MAGAALRVNMKNIRAFPKDRVGARVTNGKYGITQEKQMRLAIKILAFLCLATPALAMDNVISVRGIGQVSAVPDMAEVTLGVRHGARESSEAMDKVNADVKRLLAGLSKLGVAATDMQSTDLGLHPQWEHRNGTNQPPQLVGYEAYSSLRVKLRDIATLGAVLDQVVGNGANEFHGVRFDVQDDAAMQAKARALAIADARKKASDYAAAAGIGLGPVVQISEVPNGSAPMPMMMARAQADMAVAPGQKDMSTEVLVVFSIK